MPSVGGGRGHRDYATSRSLDAGCEIIQPSGSNSDGVHRRAISRCTGEDPLHLNAVVPFERHFLPVIGQRKMFPIPQVPVNDEPMEIAQKAIRVL
jgi:hypothetical protein